jgi:mRNA-degrading endonuclease RelE of RelBE toxin-antitoxin system
MREVFYHRHAVRYLKRMPVDRKEQVKAAIAEVAAFSDVLVHPAVKSMRGEWDGCLLLRVGGYRVIFRISENMEVLHVGPRGDVY